MTDGSPFARRRAELAEAERLLATREAAVTELEAHQGEREASLARREAEVEAQAAPARAEKRARHGLLQERRQALAAVAGETVDAARQRLTEALTESGAHALRKRARVHDEQVARDGAASSQRILAGVTQRYDGVGHLE